MNEIKVIPPYEGAAYILVDCRNARTDDGLYVHLNAKDARNLASELLLAAKKCEVRDEQANDRA